MAYLAAVLLSVMLFAGLVLFVPFRLFMRGGYNRCFYGLFRAAWLGGFVSAEHSLKENVTVFFLGTVPIYRSGVKRKKKRRPAPEKEGKKKKKDLLDLALGFPVILKSLGKIIISLSPRGELKGRVGLGDPADTGFFFGSFSALNSVCRLSVTVTPDFERRAFVFEGILSVRVLFASLLAILAGAALSPGGRRILRQW